MVRTSCHSAVWFLALALLPIAGATAHAQMTPAPEYAPPPPQYAPPGAAPVPVVIHHSAPRFLRWGIGLHLGGVGVTSERDEDDGDPGKTELGLVGLQLRFRLHRRWELELDLTHMEGELPGPGDTRRSTGAVILGGMFHINPDSRWLWSVLAGIGGGKDRVWYEKSGERVTQAEFVEGIFRLGIGLERRFDRWGLAAQLYGVGMARDEEELDGPAYIGRDGPVPEQSSGGLFQLVGNYYF